MTGTYCFKIGFYGLKDMPAEFKKMIDATLIGLTNKYYFLDDILIVSEELWKSTSHSLENVLKKWTMRN